MKNLFAPALRSFLFLTVLTGLAYPALVTLVTQTMFANAANGSLVELNGKVAGSELIGQKFAAPGHFWSRPSAVDYAAMPGGASNLGSTSLKLRERVAGSLRELGVAADASDKPYDLLLSSGSGLDPHIRPESAAFQIERVARARGISEESLRALVLANTQGPTWGLLGRPRVNVLRLNLALDALAK